MGYEHIPNLYKDQRILLFRECFALEKVHGTSAHVSYRAPSGGEAPAGALEEIHFFSGGESNARFCALPCFERQRLLVAFAALGHTRVVVYGEAYGGKQQGMSGTYGKELQFIAFDVTVGDDPPQWLSVPDAVQAVEALGLEFVPFENRIGRAKASCFVPSSR